MGQETWQVEGMTLIRPKTADEAIARAMKWSEKAGEWEPGSAERAHSNRVAMAFAEEAGRLRDKEQIA